MTDTPKRKPQVRKGIPIRASKGGRTARIHGSVTPETKQKLDEALKRNGESLGDFITRKMEEDKLYFM